MLRARADRLLSSSGYEQAFLSRTKLGRTKNVSFNKVEEIWGGEQVSQGSVERREIERETNILEAEDFRGELLKDFREHMNGIVINYKVCRNAS